LYQIFFTELITLYNFTPSNQIGEILQHRWTNFWKSYLPFAD